MRLRYRLARHLVPFWLVSVSVLALEVGDAWSEPPPELGRPLGRIATGDKTLFRWPDLEVTVAAGRVIQIRRLDAASVATETEERVKANASERARLLAERKERARKEAERAERVLAESRARDQAGAEAAGREEALRRQESEKALAEEPAKLAAKEREASARTRLEGATAGQADPGVSRVKPPADPSAKLRREIEFLELDLKRVESSTEPRDRAEAARLRLLLRERRAQLEALARPKG